MPCPHNALSKQHSWKDKNTLHAMSHLYAKKKCAQEQTGWGKHDHLHRWLKNGFVADRLVCLADSRALVTQIQLDSAPLFLEDQCPVWEQNPRRLPVTGYNKLDARLRTLNASPVSRIQLGVAAQLWRAELSLPCDSLPPHLARRLQNPYRLAPLLHCSAIRASLVHNKEITYKIRE